MSSKLIEEHLNDVTVDNLMDFRADAFDRYAKARGVEIGVNAVGQFVVKTKDNKYTINNPAEAIEKYKELVRI